MAPVSPVTLAKPISSPRTSVIDSDEIVRWQFEICHVDILFWPNFDLFFLRKTLAKVSFTPTSVAPVAEIHEVADIGDGDLEFSEPENFPLRIPAVEVFPEYQEQERNFIVEDCLFRGDIAIPNPPPSDGKKGRCPGRFACAETGVMSNEAKWGHYFTLHA
jgi:hypothetical protein